uniref:Secreted protein n=1 Tax=Arundo donax TaxID=35708 RepID=A0A0A9D3W6_ARUDO
MLLYFVSCFVYFLLLPFTKHSCACSPHFSLLDSISMYQKALSDGRAMRSFSFIWSKLTMFAYS